MIACCFVSDERLGGAPRSPAEEAGAPRPAIAGGASRPQKSARWEHPGLGSPEAPRGQIRFRGFVAFADSSVP